MKMKNLVLMILALVVLAGVAKWSRRAPRAADTSKPQKLVTFDVNAADRITVASAGQTAVVAKAADGWVVDNLWGYPANATTLRDNVRRVAETEGLLVRGGESNPAEFGLDPAATNKATDLAVVSFSGGGKPLGQVSLGAPRLSRGGGESGYPDGQYVRADSGPVLVTKDYFGGFPRRPQDWADKELLTISRSDVDYVMVQAADGSSYGLISDSNGQFRLNGIATNEAPKSDGIDAVAGALSSVSWANVLDPKTPDAQTGLNKPATYVAHLKSGISYTLKVGNVSTQDSGRIVRVAVSYEKPEPPAPSVTTNAEGKVADALKDFESAVKESEKKAAEAHARMSPWIYVLSDYTAGNLVKPRADLVQPATNAPAAAPGAPAPAP